MTIESKIPPAGQIEIVVPPEVELLTSSTLSTASCKKYTCINETPQSIRFLIAGGFSKGEKIKLEVGGVHNPRSFKPTGEFIITSYDTDGASLIDTGYKGIA